MPSKEFDHGISTRIKMSSYLILFKLFIPTFRLTDDNDENKMKRFVGHLCDHPHKHLRVLNPNENKIVESLVTG